MATRSEAKQALWEASKKDDAAKEFLSDWIADNSQDAPGGYVDDDALAKAVKDISGSKGKK